MNDDTPSSMNKEVFYSNRFLGLSLILTQVLIIVAYGILGSFY